MKVLIVNGSSHVNGTTMQAIQEVQTVFLKCQLQALHIGILAMV